MMWNREQANSLFVDYVALAMTAHMAHAYAGLNPNTGIHRQGQCSGSHEFLCPLNTMLKKPAMRRNVAMFCGFADQSHFTRVFTAMAGHSPGVWRRIHAVGLNKLGYPAVAARRGCRTALIFPLFPPPQKNRSLPSDSRPDTKTPLGIPSFSRTSPV